MWEEENEGGGGIGMEMDLYDEDGLLREDDGGGIGGHNESGRLLDSVHKILDIKKKGRGALRREAIRNVEEFGVVKRKGNSTLNKLLESVKAAGGEDKAVDKVSSLVKNVPNSKKDLRTLQTPLEKPQALKAKRTILYDHAKKEVSRFNAIVYHNRLADQLVFDSGTKTPKMQRSADRVADFIPMTPLEEEMARVLYGEDYVKQKKAELEKPKGPTDAEAYALSVEEAMNMHSEMAKLRAKMSYEAAKSKRQSKIKSRKYHRLVRKEKIRKQLKEFEDLQQKDPDAALLKLEELNKSRIQERMTLKHKNTTKWAKMQAARAKYNRDSRMALQEHLQINKQLTTKVQVSSDEEDDADLEIPQLVKSSLDNPWLLQPEVKDNEKLQLYYTGYKKLYEEINAKREKERREQELLEKQKEKVKEETKRVVKKLADGIPDDEEEDEPEIIEEVEEEDEDEDNSEPIPKPTKKRRKKKKKPKTDKNKNSNKLLKLSAKDEDFTELDLEMMVEKAEDEIKAAATKQLRKLTKEEKLRKRIEERKKKFEEKRKQARKSRDGDADEIREIEVNPNEQILENGEESSVPKNSEIFPFQKKKATNNNPATIDPSNYLKISKKSDKVNKFDGSQMDFEAFDEADEEEEDDDESDSETQRKLIAEAFEDDDVIDEFRRRKDDEIESSKPKDIDLSLPGWGEWGGKGIKSNPKKKEKFIIKAKPVKPRKDQHMSHVILNEEAGEKIKNHLVRELPFPFKRVKDFEKIIRAPVGRTFLPEKAMKDLTAPKVITRLGNVIEPLDESVLAKSKDGSSKDLEVPLSIKRLARVRKQR